MELSIVLMMLRLCWLASIIASFGILSGPVLFPLCRVLMFLFISFWDISLCVCSYFMFVIWSILLSMFFVHSACDFSPSLAWYRFLKVVCYVVFCLVRVIVSYSSWLPFPISLFLIAHEHVGVCSSLVY